MTARPGDEGGGRGWRERGEASSGDRRWGAGRAWDGAGDCQPGSGVPEASTACTSTRPSLYPLLAGGYSWGLGPVPTLSPTPPSAHDGPVGPEEDEAQQTAALIAGALGSLLTPLFLRGVLAFLIWWIAACQLLSSLFGLYFHQHLAG